MTSKGKGIYKTFKRSISNSMATVGDAFSQSSSGVKYGGGSGKTWIHPPDVLLNGKVEYSVKFLGSREVDKPKGTEVIRDAITAIRFQLQVKRSETGHSGAKLQKVDLQINVEGVIIADSKTKMVLHRYPLQRISFCADDKQDKRVFSFIAKAEGESNRHDCFVFLSDKLAEQITLTVGEAFDLAYKRYMDRNKSSLETQKQILYLRKRIAELEQENQVLSQRLAENLRSTSKNQVSLLDAPALPSTPMPSAPPPGVSASLPNTSQAPNTPVYQNMPSSSTLLPNDPFSDLLSAPSQFPTTVNTSASIYNTLSSEQQAPFSSPSGPAPAFPPPPCPTLAPPPPVASRRNVSNQGSTQVSPDKNSTGSEKNTVFDDDFDPRATSKKEPEKKDYDPFGEDFLDDVLRDDLTDKPTSAARPQPTADDFQAMIDKVDKKLAEMSTGFSGGQLDVGEVTTGEAFKEFDESEYGTPLDRVNPEVVGVNKSKE
ncbi:unnamed protein product [Auanema sp. JU1783]|nr:unnamed protein product [Auanema sp. JU1783]